MRESVDKRGERRRRKIGEWMRERRKKKNNKKKKSKIKRIEKEFYTYPPEPDPAAPTGKH